MRGAVFDILRSCTAFASNDHIPSETPMKVDQDTLRSVLGDLDCKDKKLRYRKITADGWLIRSKLIEYSHLLSDRTEGKGGHRILLTSNWAFQLLYLPYLEECAAIHPSEVGLESCDEIPSRGF